MILKLVVAPVFVALFNAGFLALTTDAPSWAVMAVALLSVSIVVWGTP